jgi:hypothetical protein
METEHKKPWEILSRALCAAAVLLWLFAWSMEYQYIETLPRQPNPSVGRIYPYNYHGIVLWRTLAEKTRVNLLEYLSFVLFLAGALIADLKCKVSLFPEKPALRIELPTGFSRKRKGTSAYRLGLKVRSLYRSVRHHDK